MRTLFVVLAVGMMSFAVTGCKKDTKTMDSSTQTMSADACPHCAGTQVANADGTCPKCGMKVK